jgi:hypothetical protein
LFYFVVVTDLNPHSRDPQQDAYEKSWSLTLREEYRMRVFENRVQRTKFGPKRDEVTGDGENCIMRSFITCTLIISIYSIFGSHWSMGHP